MSAFRFVRRSRRPAAPSRVTVARPQLVQLEGRENPAGPVVLSPQAPFASALNYTPSFPPSFAATSVLPAHFTSSGNTDFVTFTNSGSSGTLEVGLNNGDATFSKLGTLLTPPTFATVTVPIPNQTTNGAAMGFPAQNVIAVGDFLGAAKTNAPDGIDEIAVLTQGDFFANTARVVILKSDGTGGFSQAASVPVGNYNSLVGIAAGDVNGDGAADIVVTRSDSTTGAKGSTPNEYTVLLNSKSGTFTTVQRSSNSTGFTQLVRPQIADVDGDGNADLVAYDGQSSSAGTVVIFWGDGLNKGTFEAKPATLALPTGSTANIALGNFGNRFNPATGKPLLSIATTTQDFNARDTLYVLNQSPTAPRSFPAKSAQTVTPVAGGGSFSFPYLYSLGVGDFNFDGVPDLVVGDGAFTSSFSGSSSRVYLFKGSDTGLVTPGTQYQSSGSVAGLAVADFDGNQLPDVLAAQESSSGTSKIPEQYQAYLNLTKIGGEVTVTSSSRIDPFTGNGVTSYGQPITLTASVSKFINPATGVVNFVAAGPGGSVTLNSQPIALVYDPTTKTSVATFTVVPPTTDFLNAGTYKVTAQYTSGNYPDATSVPVTEKVDPLATVGTLTPSANPLVFGQPVTLSVNVQAVQPAAGPPVTVTPVGGTVAFFDNGDLIGAATVDANGVAALTLPGLPLGDHPIRAQFLATTNFTASFAPPDKTSLVFNTDGTPAIDPFTGLQQTTTTPQSVVVTVNRANSTTAVSTPAGTVNFGQPVTLTSKVSIAAPGQGSATGSVEFFRDGTSVGTAALGPGGVASLDVPDLPAGTYTFTSKFLGNTAVAPSNAGSSVGVTVTPTASVVALSGPSSNRLGGTVTLTATVTNPAGQPVSVGSVTFAGTGPDGRPITLSGPVAVVNGTASLDVTGLALGTSTFTASFSGAPPSITGGTAPQTVVVSTGKATPGFTLTDDAGGTTVPLAKDVTYTATFTAPTGLSTPPTGSVTFLDGTAVIGSAPLVNGVATFTTRLGKGPHTVTASYAGDATYQAGGFDTSVNVIEPASGFLVASGSGGTDAVNQYNPDGTLARQVFAFGPDSTSGVRVAYADFNGDGVPDIVAGSGPGTPARVRILDGATLSPIFESFPFDNFAGGLFVAAGDVNGDNRPDLVVSPDVGGGPRVIVFDGNGFKVMTNYFGIQDPDFRGGARVAVGDVNNDGFGEVIVSAGVSGGPRISVWDGRTFVNGGAPVKLFGDFFAFEDSLRNGAYVAAGDINGDGFADLIFGAGPGGGPRVVAMSGRELTTTGGANRSFIANFFGGDVNARGGVPVNTVVRTPNGQSDILVGSAEGSSAVSVYKGTSFKDNLAPAADLSFSVFDDGSNPNGGVFVG